MRRLALALGIVVGCKPPATMVFVDLDRLTEGHAQVGQPAPLRTTPLSSLPGASRTLSGQQGAQIDLSATADRVRDARRLIEENRQQALRGLTRALYRSYARAVEAERELKVRDLEKVSEALWDAAFGQISQRLQGHARTRLPMQNVLALIVGFPYENPGRLPRPEDRHDAKRLDLAIQAWKDLLTADRAFAEEAERILGQVRQELDSRRVQIQVDLSQGLNSAAEKSQMEAQQALQSSLPDFLGTLSQRPDLRLPAVPPTSVILPPVPVPTLSDPRRQAERLDLRREFLEQELSIWLAQNGYVLARNPGLSRDRTKEFAAWIKQRQPGT